MTTEKRLALIICSWLHLALLASAFSAGLEPPPKGFTGVRFSLYPNVLHDKGDDKSLKLAIKKAVKGLDTLGLEVLPDDVSSCLLGPEPALFEAMRVAFGRAGCAPNDELRQVSMSCTFSAGCPGEPDESPLPERTLSLSEESSDTEFCADAFNLPKRVACQFSIYPLGTEGHMGIISDVIRHAKKSPAWKEGKSYFCSTLDGDGEEVFEVLRSSFALARESAGHVVMTATITANKRQWRGL